MTDTLPAPAPVVAPPTRTRTRTASTQKWSRLVHAYASMIALLVVLFFGVTGITANHPEWTLGGGPTTTTRSGTLAFDATSDGTVDYLRVSEFLRDTYGITAEVSDYGTSGTTASISYRAPGYAADTTVDTETGEYRLTVEEQGFLGVMNDLHKGRDTGSAWRWVIDAAGAFLVLIALSGIVLQLVLKRRRRSALVVAGAGTVVVLALLYLAL